MWMTTLYETSRLTLELRDIVENGENSVDIWDFEYPSYYKDEEKKAFEQKVIDHYYFRQIGQETVGRFLHCFRTRIREIMPYYIQLYKSQELMESIEDPFGNVNVVETFEQTTRDSVVGSQQGETSGTIESESTGSKEGQTSGTAQGESTGKTSTSDTRTTTEGKVSTEEREKRFSNTPQGSIDNLDNYMTEATKENNSISDDVENNSSGSGENNTEGTSSESTSGTSSEDTTGTYEEVSSGTSSLNTNETKEGSVSHTYTKKGNQGVNTFAHDMKELRETFLNIDLMVINELNDLFLGVY